MAGINITKEHAESIIAKLEAQVVRKGRAHDLAIIRYRGVRIAQFGIRRGSSRNAGHGHIPGALSLSPRRCRELAICTMSVAEWHDVMRRLNLLPDED